MKPFVILVAALLLVSCAEESTQGEKPGQVPFDVLRVARDDANGMVMQLLVDPSATRADVLKLGDELFSKYRERTFVMIDIFDSRDAWQNRDNPSYPEKTYSKHWLTQIDRNGVQWLAEGRDN